jgi:hypothetical protein
VKILQPRAGTTRETSRTQVGNKCEPFGPEKPQLRRKITRKF